MTTATKEKTAPTSTGTPELCHLVCTVCQEKDGPELALCGEDLTNDEEVPRGTKVIWCLVCMESRGKHLKTCGSVWLP